MTGIPDSVRNGFLPNPDETAHAESHEAQPLEHVHHYKGWRFRVLCACGYGSWHRVAGMAHGSHKWHSEQESDNQ